MTSRKKILFIYSPWTTFTKTDYEILSEKYIVKKYQFKPQKGLFKVALEILKQFLYLIINIWRFDVVYIWFADSHSFLPILFAHLLGKKSYLVIGGFDVARLRDLGYGVFTSKIRGYFAIFSMNYCTLNLTVSKYVDRKVKWIAGKSSTQLVYNCIEFNSEKNKPELNKENVVITVAVVEKEQTFYVKGLDTFIDVARQLPQYKFLIIGINRAKLKHLLSNLPDNLILKEKTPHHELIAYYQKAKIYCQLSRSESFGVALTEGIYYNNIPIITNIGGLPEVVGDTGYIVKREPKRISKIIQEIIDRNSANAIRGNERVNSAFSLETRKLRLQQIIDIKQTVPQTS